jgi:hypothetical protein
VQLNQSSQPPEAEPQEGINNVTSSFDLSELPKPELSGHAWRQRGTELVCESCPFTHATYMHPDYQLYGIDDKGIPMIRKIKF